MSEQIVNLKLENIFGNYGSLKILKKFLNYTFSLSEGWHENLITKDLEFYEYSAKTSVDVKILFSACKNILVINRIVIQKKKIK